MYFINHLILLAVALPVAGSIRCYSNQKDPGDHKNIITCPETPGVEVCLKQTTLASGVISRSCALTSACGPQGQMMCANDALNLTHICCCGTDFCNDSPGLGWSQLNLLLVLAGLLALGAVRLQG